MFSIAFLIVCLLAGGSTKNNAGGNLEEADLKETTEHLRELLDNIQDRNKLAEEIVKLIMEKVRCERTKKMQKRIKLKSEEGPARRHTFGHFAQDFLYGGEVAEEIKRKNMADDTERVRMIVQQLRKLNKS